MTKIILDTNIIFSALAFDKSLESLLIFVMDNPEKFQIFKSHNTSFELTEKLNSQKFLAYRNFNLDQVNNFLDLYFQKAILIFPSQKINLSRDLDDNKFLELAKEVGADYLITGDKDLLTLKTFEKTKILKPSQFLELGL
jgi:uncharacterized protein